MPRRHSFRSGFSSSARTGFISGHQITQNQGGGEKKAGLVPSVGNDSWSSMFRGISDPIHGRCCSAKSLATTLVFTKNINRPTDGRVGNYRTFP
jgi:hypothetical protein